MLILLFILQSSRRPGWNTLFSQWSHLSSIASPCIQVYCYSLLHYVCWFATFPPCLILVFRMLHFSFLFSKCSSNISSRPPDPFISQHTPVTVFPSAGMTFLFFFATGLLLIHQGPTLWILYFLQVRITLSPSFNNTVYFSLRKLGMITF